MQIFQSLYEALNRDIKFRVRSVDDSEDAQSTQDSSRLNEDVLRYLTIPRYTEQPIRRKMNSPFQLRYASHGEASNMMCNHCYAWHNEHRPPHQGSPNALSFAIELDNQPIASATLVFDTSDSGMSAEDLFPKEVAELRKKHDRGLCELTFFSLNKNRRSRRAVAGLFHVMFLYARQARQMEGMLALTKTQHVGVYDELMGFRRIAQSGDTVLVFMPFDVMRTRIRQFGGKPELDQASAGIYKFFFPAKDEAGLLFRVLEHLASSGTSEGVI